MGTKGSRPILDKQVEAAMAASRVFVAIVVSSLDGSDSIVTLRQLRALVILVDEGPMNLATLADRMQVHPSNATRLCDQLVKSALLNRVQSDADRRQLVLTATAKGRRVVDDVMNQRRSAMREVLLEMTAHDRGQLTDGLEYFAAAAADVEHGSLWTS